MFFTELEADPARFAEGWMTSPFGPIVGVHNISGASDVVLVCEHASRRMPDGTDLGLDPEALASHIAWDIGALAVARRMSGRLGAPLVHGCISRLMYDCNRPPEAADAIPVRAEAVDVPGNRRLTGEARLLRVESIYRPFEATLARVVSARPGAALITVHTFTPVWFGRHRRVEVGILHGEDPRLANAMMACVPPAADLEVRLNEPYAAGDGVTHTIDRHGARTGRLNVMLEVRNDLVAAADGQDRLGDLLASWIEAALPIARAERAIA